MNKKNGGKQTSGKGGRPPYSPSDADRDFVLRAIQAGSLLKDISKALNIDRDTLNKHYRFEIMTGRERLKVKAVRVLNDALDDGSLDAAKFTLSRVAKWTERSEHDLTTNGESLQPPTVIRFVSSGYDQDD